MSDAFLGRMKWKISRIHVIKYITMPKDACMELFEFLHPRASHHGGVEVIIPAAKYEEARKVIFSAGGWPGRNFQQYSVTVSFSCWLVQQAGLNPACCVDCRAKAAVLLWQTSHAMD